MLGGFSLFLLLLFHADAIAMATIWWTSSTFSHCLVVPPILGWLVWQRRRELALLVPASSFWGLGIVGAGGLAWLLGDAASVSFGRQLGLVLMLQGGVVAFLGLSVARGLLFPLAYAFFLVPFGEQFVPALQGVTAELSMLLLGLSGVPAHIEGVFITTPAGYFEVAEACSGIKFLIAMIALGTLAANLCFRSWTRRIAFLAACVIVPIIANGIRAFGTIYIAEGAGIAFAESVDHVVYGWFFFALVIALVLALGWRFFDRSPEDRAFDPAAAQRWYRGKAQNRWVAAALAVALVVLPPLWMSATAAAGRAEIPALALPVIAGWQRSDTAMQYPWQARYAGADRIAAGRLSNTDGATVDLAVGFYADQRDGREVIGFGQGGLPPESDWSWVSDSRAVPSGRAYRITAPGPVVREVAQYAIVGGAITGSDSRAKLATMRVRLLGGDRRAVGIVISAEGDGARAAIDAFLADAGGIEQLVDRTPGLAD
ncbi:exosortase A [Parasphingopyxis sp. GrpM-11]|uniref:Exosortase A n=2 Tax=Parasphingopyxis marina TaxID=2761622 RepID=A0A842I159_9SPHN|nr:exosortase A [Parasphingopyxis marina]